MMSFESGRRRVLVVDDDRAILELVSTRLTLGNYDVFTARDGYEALDRLKSLRPAAMVLDLSMPGLDGFGVLERMGKPAVVRTPTLVLTARHASIDVERAVQLGARDYLTKPFKDNQLLARVARLFRVRTDTLSLDATISLMEELI